MNVSKIFYHPSVAPHYPSRGMTLIDVLVGVFIITTVFFALFGAFKLSVELVFSTKAKTSAVALLSERIEYIRSLAYDDVGTVGGIPPGLLEPVSQTTLNGIPYTIRTLVQYTDSPEDGLDDLDDNGITADYKTVKVEVLWMVKDSARSTFAVTRLAPVGLETLAGGGTLRVNVFDAVALPVPQAVVRVINATVIPAIDVTAQTNTNGVVSFPGAPESTGYEIYVSKTGFSTAQTYGVTVQNPNPSPTHVSVAEGDTTTVSFAIAEVGELSLITEEPPSDASFTDTFTDETGLSSISQMRASGGALVLNDSGGVFELSGNATSATVDPTKLVSWESFDYSANVPANTTLLVNLYYFDGSSFVLVPDAALPGNSAGLAPGVTSLSGLATSTYQSLRAGVVATSDGSVTPEVFDWEFTFTSGPHPLPNVDLTVFGSKTIGTTAGGLPILKFSDDITTNQYGEWTLTDLEWDVYSITAPGTFDVVELCPRTLTVVPAGVTTATVTLAPNTAHSLRVVVESGGVALPDATVEIERVGESFNKTSSLCGQVYVGSLSNTTYTVSVTHPNHQIHTEDVAVSGDVVLVIPVIPN